MNTKLIGKFFVLISIAAVALGAMVFTPALPAEAAAAAVVGGGQGTLDAFGSGTAGIAGNGLVKVTGNGILWVKDLGGDAKINTFGYRWVTKFPDGWLRYEGFNGSAKVQGSNIEVKIVGVRVALHAEGTGKFYLCGRGVFKTGNITGTWTGVMKTYELK